MFRAWVIWFLSAFFMFYKFSLEVCPSVMTATLMGEFAIDATELSNLAASYFYPYLLLQIPVGILLDKYGPRKVTTIAILLCAVGSLIFARSESFLMAGVGRVITGFGAAFAAVNCLKLIAIWFPSRKFPFMAGLMMTVAMLGAVFGQAPLSLFMQTVGWRGAIEFIAIVGLLLAFIFFIVVRDQSVFTKKEHKKAHAKVSIFKSIQLLLKNKQSWWLSIYSGLAFAPVMVFGGLWGVSFTKEAFSLEEQLAAQAVSLIFVGFAVGAPTFGLFSDWMKKRRSVMFFGTLVASVCISSIIYLPGLSQTILVLLFFVFGFSISSFLLCFTMIRENNPLWLAATAVGFMNAFDAFFGAFSDPIAGKILDLTWMGKLEDGARLFSIESYKIAFLIIPIYLFLSLLSLYFVKETKPKETKPSALP